MLVSSWNASDGIPLLAEDPVKESAPPHALAGGRAQRNLLR
jgi:hypothetical protein